MSTIAPFNHDWLYCPEQVGDDVPDSAFVRVTIPHTNKLFPHHNFEDSEYQFISTYRKRFTLPEPLLGRRLYVDFEGAMIAATVTINGHTFPEHQGGYTPFSHDITAHVRAAGENVLTVHLDSTERRDIPPFGHTVDYLTFGGIYREIQLRYEDPVFVRQVFVRTYDVMTETPRVEVDLYLVNTTDEAARVKASVGVLSADAQEMGRDAGEWTVAAQCEVVETVTVALRSAVQLWSPDSPTLYTVRVDYAGDRDAHMNVVSTRIGFRTSAFRSDGYYLNGERVQLRGLNRHQLYPYIGAAAPERLQRQDADILKFELGCNLVRTSHYPQSRHFLDRCDEIGLLVFEEIPGWQHIGDAAWKALSLRDVRVMIERDRNHPSIILWGVRINESWDDREFYGATNALARELDPTRQTGGVRFFLGSEFLEDVYTLNDFSNAIMEPEHTPHLVTEFNGHMFPTKSYDHDARLAEHALRHARIQSAAATMGGVSGAIGWCAYDYNTHVEFGSGDRVCYHGVMDMFRLPKYAAYFYASQTNPDFRIVLHAATNWALGDYDAGAIEPVYVFSNCDEVEVFVGTDRIGRYRPDAESYPNLPHPPFVVRGLGIMLAQPYGDLRVVGYRGGTAVAEQHIAADHKPAALTLESDSATLRADGIDMARVVFRIVDKYGNRLAYTSQIVSFEISGPGALIGENPFALVGGQAALYVKAQQQPGIIVLRATTPRLDAAEIQWVVE